MAIVRLRRFSSPHTLKAIDPERLLAFLRPYESFLALHQFEFPPPGFWDDLDYNRLLSILMLPEENTPHQLLDALFLVEEMSTSDGMDSMLAAAQRRGLTLDIRDDSAPADIAVQILLQAPALLEQLHAEQYVSRRRHFELYQAAQTPLPVVTGRHLEPSAIHQLERELDVWFQSQRRGRGTRVFPFRREDGIWFLLRHGEPFRREESLQEDKITTVLYRPLRYDVVVYHPGLGELRVNARSKRERLFYRAQFGRHLFGSESFFPGTSKYTLAPLSHSGPAALECGDVEGLEWICLKEIHIAPGGSLNAIDIFKADDVFAALSELQRPFAPAREIRVAVFLVKFTDSRSPRSVTIKPSNIALYTRDSDAVLVEEWLAKRGFITDEGGSYGDPFADLVCA